MKTELNPCFILHSRPYRETSLILDVFSLEHGRVNLVARGVKRGKRNLALLLQPAGKLNLAWSMRTEMGTVTDVEPAEFRTAGLSGRRLVSCFYMNELLVRMLHKHEPHPDLFRIYEASLERLGAAEDEGYVLRIFEKHLLKILGYGLVLDQETGTGQPVMRDKQYFYRIDQGPVSETCPETGDIGVSGKTLLALETESEWNEDIAVEAKRLFRTILSAYTGPKPLGSRELYKAYLQYSLKIKG